MSGCLERRPYPGWNAQAEDASALSGSGAALLLWQSGISDAVAGRATLIVLHRIAAAKKKMVHSPTNLLRDDSTGLDWIPFNRADQGGTVQAPRSAAIYGIVRGRLRGLQRLIGCGNQFSSWGDNARGY